MSLSEKLISAAKKGNAREVRKLLGRGALFTKDQYGNTALHEAAWNGNKDIVKALLGAFCFVDSINNTGFTPLHLASQNGHAKVAKLLLKWRADPTLLNQHGETALHLVAKYNHPSVVSAFATYKIPMDIRGKDGVTPLLISAKLGNIEVMKLLLHHGADPTITDVNGLRPLDFTETSNYKECSKLIHSALLKWKPKTKLTSSGVSPNKYTYEDQLPTARKRAETLGNHLSSSTATVSKIHLVKTKGGAKQHSFSKEKRAKSGYFSEDETYKSQVPIQPHSRRASGAQEVPNGFSYGARGGAGMREGSAGVQFQPLRQQSASPVPNNKSASKSASIDQLLNEIEREYNGPGYRYSPPAEQPNGLITPYAEIRQLEPPYRVRLENGSLTTSVPTQSSPLDKAKQFHSLSQDNYDFLKPTKPAVPSRRSSSMAPSSHHHRHHSPLSSSRSSSHYSQHGNSNVRGVGATTTPTTSSLSPRYSKPRSRSSKSPSCSPPRQLKVQHSFPTRSELQNGAEGEDMDTYVYMARAPLNEPTESEGAAAKHTPVRAATRGTRRVTLESVDTDLESESDVSLQLRDGASGCEASPSTVGDGAGSKNSKRAVICNSPLEADRRLEPDLLREPVKGILSQSSVTDADKSTLERYLQEELETMRQAFQIRLGQLEKRYQKQLMMEQKRNNAKSHTPPGGVAMRSRRRRFSSSDLTNTSQRRNSWHSYIPSEQELEKLAQPDVEPRSGSSLGIDSDHSVDSDIEPWIDTEDEKEDSNQNEVPISLQAVQHARLRNATSLSDGPVYSIPNNRPARGEGLKGGAKSWQEEAMEENANAVESPQLSPFNSDLGKEETSSIDKDAKKLIHRKMGEYREKMMKYFQEKSEAQICLIEEKYQQQINEVRKKYDEQASEKMTHLTTRIKDLENMLDVQTMV